ncbi:flagellar hook-associated protein FlgK [Pararhizobium haloflavum]|uniref:flagellar hook-associated protein FlgK n=1 Tax=Pararhizobium haloflavum TaxID=2037914 RepID=UPI000C1A7964|nr:flagellar hook-associated protein FlgK [Pararhizobium haloflavum]
MSLSSALNTAQSILSNTSTQTSIVSKNISNASNPHYARRAAELATNGWGAQVVNISRSANDLLFKDNIASIGAASGQGALLDGIDQLRALLGGNDYETAPSTLISNFRDALQLFASKPNDVSAARSALADAGTLADGIRETSVDVQKLRLETDKEISRQVGELNSLLSQFEKANNDVKQGTQAGEDVSDALDQRDRLLGDISSIIGVSVVTRKNNDIALYTKDGATLFETIPRAVTFEPTSGFDATIAGNPVLVDGVAVNVGTGGATSAQGSLGGLLQVRDSVAPTYQAQLDEMARGLVTMFAEGDPASEPGLFTWGDDALITGAPTPGIAMSLQVDQAFVDNPLKLRDGDSVVVNPDGNGGFSALLESFVTRFDEPLAFDETAQAGTNVSIMTLAANSVGWMETLRQQADQAAETKNASYFRSSEALSASQGVNLDEEMSKLLELEQSYKASSRLIATIDEMLNTLLASVR